MITELAKIEVKPGFEAEFEAGVKAAVPLFRRAGGCHGLELKRSLEHPSRYYLIVGWETVEHHTQHFRNSADYAEWRRLVGHYFASPPAVEHLETTVAGFGGC